MPRFSEYFRLRKTQPELDFVDVSLNNDTRLFIDPYALAKREDTWSVEASNIVVDFFETALDAIRNGDNEKAEMMLSQLSEPNETRLGMSHGRPRGRGVSGKQSHDLCQYLSNSTAAKTGFLRDLQDCELLVPGIAADKISDITTNIIRKKLVEYTVDQCQLHDIRTQETNTGRFWDPYERIWNPGGFARLPVHRHRQVILVPKAIGRSSMAYHHEEYYRHFVLHYLQSYHLNAGTSLVRLLKNGKRRVTIKSLRKEYPPSKDFLYEFSKEHPDVFNSYKEMPRDLSPIDDNSLEQKCGAPKSDIIPLANRLKNIPPGSAHASAYHDAIKGILEIIFYPFLIYPKKEQSLHEGRKRIDITFSNAATSGMFYRLHTSLGVPCPFLFFECKNYVGDPANPELDQLAGRFSVQRGRVGFIVCRSCNDRQLLIARCRDTFHDNRGWILLLTDEDILNLVGFRAKTDLEGFDRYLDTLFRTLVM